jgi:hypothetical protein
MFAMIVVFELLSHPASPDDIHHHGLCVILMSVW